MKYAAIIYHTQLMELTIFRFAGSVVRLHDIPFHTAARVRPLCISTSLAAGSVQRALIYI